MKAFFILIFALLHVLASGQEIALPMVKQGHWFLLKKEKEIDLPASYTYVHFFDQEGFAYFQCGQRYGIVDENGKEIVPAKYSDISAYGKGFFSCKIDSGYHFYNIRRDDFQTILCKNSTKLSQDWILLDKSNLKGLLVNLENNLIIPQDSSLNYEVGYNHLFIYKDSLTTVIYNPKGEKIYEGKAQIIDGFAHRSIFAGQFNYIIDAYGSWHFPKEAKFPEIDDEYIRYQLNNVAYLIDRSSKTVIMSYPCERINKRNGYYEIEKNTFTGLIDQNKKVLIEAKFDFLTFHPSFILTNFNTVKGIYSYAFKELVPCKYKSIRWDESFFYTSGVNAYQGLYSRISGKEILPAVYDNIEIKNLVLKARYNGILTIVELDKKHKIINKIALGEAITLRTNQFASSLNFKYDPRLLEIGWYFDTTNFRKKGVKWGLKTPNDSIILKAKHKNVSYVENAPFSIINEDFTDAEFALLKRDETYLVEQKHSLINFSNGKKLKTTILYHIDTMDFTRRNYARYVDSLNFGIVYENNSVKKMTYIDLDESDYLRYCYSPKFTRNMGANALTIPYPYLNKWKPYFTAHKGWIEYHQAKWNFLDRNGDSLFKESFGFVQNFYKKTAIVMRDNSWGLVNRDTIVIPLEYTSVTRLKEYRDTVFLLSKQHQRAIFLDSNLNLRKDLGMQFETRHGPILVFKKQDKYLLYHTDGSKIFETEKMIKFHTSEDSKEVNLFVIRDKKTYAIYDANGKLVGEVKSKPESFVSENAFIVENSTKKGLISVDGDTLLPVEFSEILYSKKYILAKKLQEYSLFSSDYKLIKSTPDKKILLDTLGNLWALVDENKIQVYDADNKLLAKLKTEGIEYTDFHNKLFFSTKTKVNVMDLTGKQLDFHLKFSEIKALDGTYFALLDENKAWRIYDQKLTKIAHELPEIRKIASLGDHIFGFKTKQGFIIYDVINHKNYSDYKNAVPNWEEGLLLVEKRSGKFPYEFLNREFENPLQRSFKSASLFLNGMASISDERGWTIIDKNGLQKSYPNFNRIQNLAKNIFLSTEKTLYGISDQHGKQIIAVEYEQLNFINDKIIQGIKEGVIFYFDYQGNRIHGN